MNIKFLMRSVLAAFMAAALVANQAQAQTQPAPEGEKPAKSKPKKAAKPGSKAKFIPGSSETVAQRTARLKRECKGAVDAGACSGYTR
jgi:Spy/CpxP family protein refolding chaperone